MDKPANYRITVQGELPERWLARLGGLKIALASSEGTTLEGWLPDQAALSGVLDTLYTLHLPIVEVIRLKKQ
jgi:hypothetical protein